MLSSDGPVDLQVKRLGQDGKGRSRLTKIIRAISYLCLRLCADLEMKKYTWNLRANSRWMQHSGIAQVRSRAGVARLEGNLALYLLPAGESPEVPRGSGCVVLKPKGLHHSLSQTSIEIFKKLSGYVRGLFFNTRIYKSILFHEF